MVANRDCQPTLVRIEMAEVIQAPVIWHLCMNLLGGRRAKERVGLLISRDVVGGYGALNVCYGPVIRAINLHVQLKTLNQTPKCQADARPAAGRMFWNPVKISLLHACWHDHQTTRF
jgi:hypothetical protein